MIMMATDHLVDDYLRRLDKAAASLPPQRRAELVAEIREHVEEALRETDATGEVAVRNVLERIGPPDEIVTAATGSPAAAHPEGAPDRAGRLEIAALIALVVPVLGWLIGVVLVVVSRAWTAREKVVGVALGLLPLLLPLAGLAVGAESSGNSPVPVEPAEGLPEAGPSSGAGPFEVILIVWLLFAGLPSAIYLGWRLRRSKDALS